MWSLVAVGLFLGTVIGVACVVTLRGRARRARGKLIVFPGRRRVA